MHVVKPRTAFECKRWPSDAVNAFSFIVAILRSRTSPSWIRRLPQETTSDNKRLGSKLASNNTRGACLVVGCISTRLRGRDANMAEHIRRVKYAAGCKQLRRKV